MQNRPPEWLESLQFDRIDRGRFVFDVVSWDESQSAIDQMAMAITDELKVRKRLRPGHPQFQGQLKWLKPVCYHAIICCLHNDAFDALERRIEKHQRFVRGADKDRSVFSTGLMGIFAHEESLPIEQTRRLDTEKPEGQKVSARTKRKMIIDEKSRHRMAEEMWWGFRHYVEPAELVQFNRTYPLHRNQTLPRDHLAPELFEQIISRRLDFDLWGGDLEEYRGAYPEAIEAEVNVRYAALNDHRRSLRKTPNPEWD